MSTVQNSSTSGQVMIQAVSILQTSFEEAALLFKDFDEFMAVEGWQTAYGNRTTKEVTSNLNTPRYWLLQCSFRIYQKGAGGKGDRQTRLGCSIVWWNDDVPGQEPMFVIARVDAHPGDFDHWDIWLAWEETGFSANDGKPAVGRKDDWGYIVSARRLTDVKSKVELKKLSQELLGYLKAQIV